MAAVHRSSRSFRDDALVSDEELLDRAVDRPGAFGVFYERHVDTVLAMARSRAPIASAFDITAEVFAVALDSVARFRNRGPGSALAWVIGIARHEIANHYRRDARRRSVVNRLEMARTELTSDEIRALEARVDATRSDVMAHLMGLPDHERLAVYQYIVDDRGYASIAQEHGISESAARKRVSRGLFRIRRRVNEEVQR